MSTEHIDEFVETDMQMLSNAFYRLEQAIGLIEEVQKSSHFKAQYHSLLLADAAARTALAHVGQAQRIERVTEKIDQLRADFPNGFPFL